VTVSYLVGV